MNPNCGPDSPGDVVLLFETKAGWNLHGGPELFTFDNHDPKGGCVLLNDGSVKFIRTEERPPRPPLEVEAWHEISMNRSDSTHENNLRASSVQ
jgi:hypothetical protein